LEALLELSPDHRRVFGPLGNCAWSEVARQSGRWRLVRHNSWIAPLSDEAAAAASAGGLRAVPTPTGNGAAAAVPVPPDERTATSEGDADAVG
jgi:probable phosphoglycerate mutase